MSEVSRIFVFAGLALVFVGLALWAASAIGLGRLPGDIVIERPGMRIAFPLATSIILSIALTIVAQRGRPPLAIAAVRLACCLCRAYATPRRSARWTSGERMRVRSPMRFAPAACAPSTRSKRRSTPSSVRSSTPSSTSTLTARAAPPRRSTGAIAAGEDPGLLAGVPVLSKDLEDAAGMPTTHGSVVFKDNVPDHDSIAHRAHPGRRRNHRSANLRRPSSGSSRTPRRSCTV